LENIFARLESCAPLRYMMFLNWECPAIYFCQPTSVIVLEPNHPIMATLGRYKVYEK